MNSRNFFSRIGNFENSVTVQTTTTEAPKVICDTPELKEFITTCMQRDGWAFENFADFIELIGIQTPVKLSEFNKNENSFKCFTPLNTELKITLCIGNGITTRSQILITEGEKRKTYTVNCNIPFEEPADRPEITLCSRDIIQNGKELRNFSDERSYLWTSKLDDIHTLKFKIDKLHYTHKVESELLIEQNCEGIERYLLSLTHPINISQVYDDLMKILGFDNENISDFFKISIYYIETIGNDPLYNKDVILGKIEISRSKFNQYTILKNGEEFHISQNGNYKYSCNGIKITYPATLKPCDLFGPRIDQDDSIPKRYDFYITKTMEDMMTINPIEIIRYVEQKISELWKFVK